jgi:hypothetical protein
MYHLHSEKIKRIKMKTNIPFIFVFLLILSFTSAEYLIYERDLNKLLDKYANDDCSGGIGSGTSFRICEKTSFCLRNYTICEDGKFV